MPETPKASKSLLTLNSNGESSPRRRTSDPPAVVPPDRSPSSQRDDSHSDHLDIHTKLLLKARSMERSESKSDVSDAKISNNNNKDSVNKKDKKKKTKRKEEEKPDPPPAEGSSSASDKDKKSKESTTKLKESSSKASKVSEPAEEGLVTSSTGATETKKARHKGDRPVSRSKSQEKTQEEKEISIINRRREKQKKGSLTDPTPHGLRAAIRAESRARTRAHSPKKKRDNPLDEPTYKPYSNLDNDSDSSEGSDKKKKKKKKKRSTSTDREVKSDGTNLTSSPTRGRSMVKGYETARVVNRSISDEKIKGTDKSPDPDAAPDPIIGPPSSPKTEKAPVAPGKKKKKKKQPEGDGEPSSSSIHSHYKEDTADSPDTDRMNGSNNLDASFPYDEDGTTPERLRRKGDAVSEKSLSSPKLSKRTIGAPLRQSSLRSAKRDTVELSQKPPTNKEGSATAPDVHRRMPRRKTAEHTRQPANNDLDSPSKSDHDASSSMVLSRKMGETLVSDKSVKASRLPIGSEDESVPGEKLSVSKKKIKIEKKESDKVKDEVGLQSPKKPNRVSRQGSLRAPPKNPMLVNQLKECLRLVSVDETGPAVEASLRGLAEYLASKGEHSALVADVLMADFVPRKDSPGHVLASGKDAVDVVNDSSIRSEGPSKLTEGQKLVFDPYKPASPPVANSLQKQASAHKVDDERHDSPPLNETIPPEKGQNSKQADATGTMSVSETGQARNASVEPGPSHSIPQQSPESQPQQTLQPTQANQQAPKHQPPPQQSWTEEQRRQYYAQQQQQQQQQQQHYPRQPVPPQNYNQQPAPNQQFYQQSHPPPHGYTGNPHSNGHRPGHVPLAPGHGPRPPPQPAAQQSHPSQYHHPSQTALQNQHNHAYGNAQHQGHTPGAPAQAPRPPSQPSAPPGHPSHYQYPPQVSQPGHARPHPGRPPHPHHVPPAAPQLPTGHQPAHYVPHGASASAGGELKPLREAILREWALLPPAMAALRPVEHLLVSVHTVLPPKFGVPSHDYFGKWTAVAVNDLWPDGARLDQNALKKTLRKVRVFLHPDRLPGDFSEAHTFVCKLLWDVIQDAETEYKKKMEELDWVG